MANFFPKWANWLPFKLLVIAFVLGAVVTGGIWYYFTPKYTNVGYMPEQPAPFSHAIHAEQLGMDCRYCHSHVEVAAHSNVPDTQTCMACHSQIKATSPKLAAVRASWETGTPVEWVRIHKAPDYVYFNHAVHVNRGISCSRSTRGPWCTRPSRSAWLGVSSVTASRKNSSVLLPKSTI